MGLSITKLFLAQAMHLIFAIDPIDQEMLAHKPADRLLLVFRECRDAGPTQVCELIDRIVVFPLLSLNLLSKTRNIFLSSLRDRVRRAPWYRLFQYFPQGVRIGF